MRRRLPLLAPFALALAVFELAYAKTNDLGYEIVAVESVPATPAQVEAGKAIYEESCAQCHGEVGDGQGTMTEFLDPKPRDFTTGAYKVRRTFAGELPTDQDVFDAIRRGLPGTSMPAWEGLLTVDQIWAVTHYIKTFSEDFAKFPPEEQLVIGSAPPSNEENLARGRVVYEEMQCAKCHGETGRGNGPSAAELQDDWSDRIWPADLTQPWTFRGGGTPEDIYRTFVTGMNGTPMPSYAPSIPPEDAWHLTNYVVSLGREPNREVVVRGLRVEKVPEDPADPAWADAPVVDFKMSPQIIEAPRLFTLVNQDVSVQALWDGDEVGILVVWDDRTENSGAGGQPPDGVAVQFAAERLDGTEKPYFLMGDRKHPVEIWRWSGATRAAEAFLAYGSAEVTPKQSSVVATGGYDDGRYRVLFRRSVATHGELDAQLAAGDFAPIAFHLWDGANDEEGLRKAVSAWYYILLEPETPGTVYAWPAVAVCFGIGLELVILRRVRKRRGA